MKLCPYCGESNFEGVFFCEECGQPFVGATGALATNQLIDEERAVQIGRPTWGTARFTRDAEIVVRVRDFDEPLRIMPQDELIMGRSDGKTSVLPDIDFAPFRAAEQGVSRQHAAIRRGEDTLTLVDLNSTNGTHLNGQRLSPDQPRVLRDGDEVRLGRLVFHIYFR